MRLASAALIGVLLLPACTKADGEATGTAGSAAPAVTVITSAPTKPTVPPTVVTTTTSSTTTTTTTIAPANTIPHGAGPITTLPDGSPVDADAAATAAAIYDAAIIREYATIKAIIGDRRFRGGFVGQRRPAEEWQKEFDEGGPDALARMVALLDLPPTVDKRGNTVWPYLATKDPAEWNDEDLIVLAGLGFRPEDIEATRFKGIYKDFRLIIGPDGIWTAFGVGY